MASNAKGPFLLCRSAIPALSRPGGAIVLLASFAGEVGLAGYSAYSSSKGAVRLLTQSLALELAEQGTTVNAIAPAYVESAMAGQALEHSPACRRCVGGRSRGPARRHHPLGSPSRRQRSGRCHGVLGGRLLHDRRMARHQRRRRPALRTIVVVRTPRGPRRKDFISRNGRSAQGTLVERTTRRVVLLRLPDGRQEPRASTPSEHRQRTAPTPLPQSHLGTGQRYPVTAHSQPTLAC